MHFFDFSFFSDILLIKCSSISLKNKKLIDLLYNENNPYLMEQIPEKFVHL